MFAKIIPTISLLVFIFVFSAAFANYHYGGAFVFNVDALKILAYEYISVFYALIAIWMAAVVYQFLYFKRKIDTKANCQVQFIELEKIATDWMENEELIDNIRSELTQDSIKIESSHKEQLKNTVGLFFSNSFLRTKNHLKEYVLDNLQLFNQDDIEIVIKLFEIIETQGDISSVASLYKDDSEKKTYENTVVTLDGKKSYDILSEVKLIDHTLNVLECSVRLLKKDFQSSYHFLLPQVVITALAHDVGKISNINKIAEAKNIEELLFRQNPHEKVSKLIFMSLFPEYKNSKAVIDAIISHHAKPESTLGKILQQADREARDIETKKWIVDNVEKNNVKNPTEINFTDDKNNNEVEKKEPPKKSKNKIMTDLSSNMSAIIEANPDLKSAFISKIMANVNYAETLPASGKTSIVSISSGKTVYFTKKFIDKTLGQCGVKTRTEAEIEAVLDVFRKDGLIVGQKIELSVSGTLNTPEGRTETFYQFDGESLGMSENDLEQSKRDSNILRNVTIGKEDKKDV